MKLAVVGCRDFFDYARFCKVIGQVKTPISLLISGGAAGTDTLVERYAREFGYSLLVHNPNWKRDGSKRCFAVRNQKIVDDAECVLAFWDHKSKGTKITIDMALAAGRTLHIITI
jgi:hypothetical protein